MFINKHKTEKEIIELDRDKKKRGDDNIDFYLDKSCYYFLSLLENE